jgi:hypothetical protein
MEREELGPRAGSPRRRRSRRRSGPLCERKLDPPLEHWNVRACSRRRKRAGGCDTDAAVEVIGSHKVRGRLCVLEGTFGGAADERDRRAVAGGMADERPVTSTQQPAANLIEPLGGATWTMTRREREPLN